MLNDRIEFGILNKFRQAFGLNRCGTGSVELKIAFALWDAPRTDLQLLPLSIAPFLSLLTVFFFCSRRSRSSAAAADQPPVFTSRLGAKAS